MTIKIVTDSGVDFQDYLAELLDIKVVPFHVIFGKSDYRNMAIGAFFGELASNPIHPTTSNPSIGEFLEAYEELIEEGADGIISIHVSEKWSGSYQSACDATRKLIEAGTKCRFEIIDSAGVGMWEGFVAKRAAELVQEKQDVLDLMSISRIIRESIIPKLHLRVILDTLEYAAKGGRLGKLGPLAGTLEAVMKRTNARAILEIKKGETAPVGGVKVENITSSLVDYVGSFPNVVEAAVEYCSHQEAAEEIANTITATFGIPVYLVKVGPVIGVHTGPGALAVVVREE